MMIIGGIVIVAWIIWVVALGGNTQSGSANNFTIGAGSSLGDLDMSTSNENTTTVKTDLTIDSDAIKDITNLTENESQDATLKKK